MEPLQEALQAQQIETLLIAADQGYRPFPFAASARRLLRQSLFLWVDAIAGPDPLAPAPSSSQRQLALGASQFESMAPLPLVPQELQRIDSPDGADRYLNADFTPQSLLDRAVDQRYARVHVATHADFRPGGPEKSVIHTGSGPMSMAQFARLRRERQDQPLDLVVLSPVALSVTRTVNGLGSALQAGARAIGPSGMPMTW